MILLVDISQTGGNCRVFLEHISWWDRLRSLGCPIIVWDLNGSDRICNLPIVTQWQDLVTLAVKNECKRKVIYIAADQLFLDTEIVENGLHHAQSQWDYFTQWEHCRLPIGIGVRAFSLENLTIASWRDTPQSLISYIKEHSQLFNMWYDPKKYGSHKFSVLDSRYSEGLKSIIDDHGAGFNFSLGGFLKLVETESIEVFRYSEPKCADFVDERLMASAYGFESIECADFPAYIMFDITNVCNSKCIHCPHSLANYGKAPKTYLSPEIFRKVIDECVGRPLQFVRITADGEPFLHPQLFEMINYAVQGGVGLIGLTTNGSLLSATEAKRLIDSGLFMVDISLDAIKKETYEKIRRSLNFDRTMKNIHRLIEIRNKCHSPLRIMVSFVKQEQNVDEMEMFKKYWTPLVDKVLIRELISNVNLINIQNDSPAKNTPRWPCPYWYRRIVINYDGTLKACPVDWENKSTYKHVSECSLYDAWHSDFYWKNRIEHLNNSFSETSICKRCRDWQGSPWSLGYEKVIKTL